LNREWFEESFGERYLRLYAHRDSLEASTAVETLFPGHALAGRTALDLACGAGRYLRLLHERGADAVGLDLSPVLLREALAQGTEAPLVRGDMRELPFGAERFDVTLCMFTSFGYFGSVAAHECLAREIARVTRSVIVLDLPDRESLEATLVGRSERRLDDRQVTETRRIVPGPRRVEKIVEISEAGGGGVAERYEERVLLFERDEIEAMFDAAGFALVDAMGDYAGRPWVGGKSPRMLLRLQRRRRP
jgi:SAM-dependent methyltransferase